MTKTSRTRYGLRGSRIANSVDSIEVVVNSTPLIALGSIGRIELLKDLFGEVVIPDAVYKEVTFKDDSAARYLMARHSWIHVVTAPSVERLGLLPVRLHAGEVEVITLAESLGNCLVVLDDGAARRTASYLGLRVTGTLGVLVAAKQRGLIDRLAPCLEKMRQSVGFRLSEAVVRQALKAAGEI